MAAKVDSLSTRRLGAECPSKTLLLRPARSEVRSLCESEEPHRERPIGKSNPSPARQSLRPEVCFEATTWGNVPLLLRQTATSFVSPAATVYALG